VSAILLCDSILKKGDEIVAQAYRLETQLSSKENEEIQVFIDVVLNNRPEFRAARFFSIDRSTLQRSQFFDHVPSRYNPVQRTVNRLGVD
jgi:hypothetical protein